MIILLMVSLTLFAREKKTYTINDYDFEIVGDIDEMSMGDLTIQVAQNFLGTPYRGGTLEGEPEIPCRYDFEGLDCVTFVENSFAVSSVIQNIKSSTTESVSFCDYITNIRYKKADKNNEKEVSVKYQDRLHYSSEWIYYNVLNNNFKDITKDVLGGESYQIDVYFMSKNRHLYPRPLKEDEGVYEAIKSNEEFINQQQFYYVPKEKISSIEDKLQNGDIIFVTSGIAGLDYNHVGLVYVDEDGIRRLMHASSSKDIRKVIIGKRVSEYVNGIKKHTGITVLRLTK